MNPHDNFDPYVYSSFYSDTIELCLPCYRKGSLPNRFFTLSLFNKTELFESIKKLDFDIIGFNTVEILLKSNISFFNNFFYVFQNETITAQKIIDLQVNYTPQSLFTEIGDTTSITISFTFISKFEARIDKIKNVYNPKHSCRAGELTLPFDITAPEIFIDLQKMTLFRRCPILHMNVFVDSKKNYFTQFIKEENYDRFSHLGKKVLYNELDILRSDFLKIIKEVKDFYEYEIEEIFEQYRIQATILLQSNNKWVKFQNSSYQILNSKHKLQTSEFVSVIKKLVIRSSRHLFDVKVISTFSKKIILDDNIINIVKIKYLEFNNAINNKEYDFNLLLKGRIIHREFLKLVKEADLMNEAALDNKNKLVLMINTKATVRQRLIIQILLSNFNSCSSLINFEKCKKEFELYAELTKERDEIMRKYFK